LAPGCKGVRVMRVDVEDRATLSVLSGGDARALGSTRLGGSVVMALQDSTGTHPLSVWAGRAFGCVERGVRVILCSERGVRTILGRGTGHPVSTCLWVRERLGVETLRHEVEDQ
jgi:hypothetical protein